MLQPASPAGRAVAAAPAPSRPRKDRRRKAAGAVPGWVEGLIGRHSFVGRAGSNGSPDLRSDTVEALRLPRPYVARSARSMPRRAPSAEARPKPCGLGSERGMDEDTRPGPDDALPALGSNRFDQEPEEQRGRRRHPHRPAGARRRPDGPAEHRREGRRLPPARPGRAPRLGLAPFVTGTEAAHGVAWLGTATVFPQPVGLAATWDAELVRRVGEAVGVEVRAKHAADPTVSLNAWAPVVNPLRNPRWGRNEEGFSEDPHLTAELATAYARGLRGDHPTVWRTVPTLKHFLGYNNETDRDVSSSHAAAAGAARVRAARLPRPDRRRGRRRRDARRTTWSTAGPRTSARSCWTSSGAPPRSPCWWSPTPTRPATWPAPSSYFADHVTLPRRRAARRRRLLHRRRRRRRPDGRAADRGPGGRAARPRTTWTAPSTRMLHLRLLTGELDPDDDPYAAITADDLDTPAHRALAREAATPRGGAAGRPGRAAAAAGRRVASPSSGRSPAGCCTTGTRAPRPTWSGWPTRCAESPARCAPPTGADVVTLRSTTSTGATCGVGPGRPAGWSPTARSPTDDARFALDDWGHGLVTLTAADGHLLTGGGGRHVARARPPASAAGRCRRASRLRPRRRRHLGRCGTSGRGSGCGSSSRPVGSRSGAAGRRERRAVRAVHRGRRPRRGRRRLRPPLTSSWSPPATTRTSAGRETQDRPDLWLPARQREILRAARAANPQLRAGDRLQLPVRARRGPTHAVRRDGLDQPRRPGARARRWPTCCAGRGRAVGRLAQAWPADPEPPDDLRLRRDRRSGRPTPTTRSPALFPFGHGLGVRGGDLGSGGAGAGRP